jgi:hypothetical protein
MFRTELTITPSSRQLSRSARVLTLGSCFADSIGSRLVSNKVETLVNPFGTVFQPLMLGQLLRAAAGEAMDWQQHLAEARGRWQSYDLHGSIGADSPVELLQGIQELVQRTGDFVRSADMVVLTLGTAWAYRLRETGELVNNCHKMPADLFHKELLTPDEVINALAETHAYLRRINPQVQLVLTVSPVRHLKDTLPLNAVSKSVLRVACHYLSELLTDVSYFPAFELLTDDLRDYRFYASDMLHPSEVAEDYIWDKFARAYFDVDFGRFRKEWNAIRQSLGHRPLHEGAPEHRQFLENTQERLQRLAEQQVDVAAELRDVAQRLATLPLPKPVLVPEPEEDDEERIDVGDPVGEAMPAAALPAAPDAPMGTARPPRLSPEEFRNQRANRDRGGRDERRNRPERERRPEQAEPVATTPVPPRATEFHPILGEIPVAMPSPAASVAAPTLTPAAELPAEGGTQAIGMAISDVATASQEPEPKKKKRRSRGGAKRTARKHAARLEAEASATGLVPAPAGNAPDVVTGSTTIETMPMAAEAPVANVLPVAAPTLPEAAPMVATDTAPVRGARPEVKKSTVIQKSTPVKRGGRRNPPVLPVVESAPAPTPTPAALVLPERPKVEATPAAAMPLVPAPEVTPPAVKPSRTQKAKAKVRPPASPAPVAAPPVEATAASPVAVPAVTPAPVAAAEPAPRPAAKPRRKGTKPKALYNPTPAVAPAVVPVPAVVPAPPVPIVAAPVLATTVTTPPVAKPARSRAKAKPVVKPTPPVEAAPAPAPSATVKISASAKPARSRPAKPKAEPKTEPAAKPAAKAAAAKPKSPRNATKKA